MSDGRITPAETPALTPEPGWAPYVPFPDVGTRVSFVSGHPHADWLRTAFFRRESDGHVVGRVWFGPLTEGPPGLAHGGSIAAVLDETLSAAAWTVRRPTVVASLTVDFRAPVSLGSVATFETWVDEAGERKVRVRGRLLDDQGVLLAEGSALCIVPSRYLPTRGDDGPGE